MFSLHELTKLGGRDLDRLVDGQRNDRGAVEAASPTQAPDLLHDDVVFEHAELTYFGHAFLGARVVAAWLAHADDAAVAKRPRHLAQHRLVVGDVMKGIVADDLVHRTVLERQPVAIVHDELRLNRPVGARIRVEQLAADIERGGRYVDRDCLAAEAVEQVRQPTGACAHLQHHFAGSDPQPVKQHPEVEKATSEGHALGERLAEQMVAVAAGEVVLGGDVELVGLTGQVCGIVEQIGRRQGNLVKVHLVGEEQAAADVLTQQPKLDRPVLSAAPLP